MDFAALPPEINSGRMYSGPGATPMLAAAATWGGLAAEFESAAESYASVISQLTGEWSGPAATAMTTTTGDYTAWMRDVGAHAEQAAAHANSAASAYEAAFDMTVPPPVIAANRSRLATLIATNLLGQNTVAIAATEAEYAGMWAQDATAMYTYAAASASASALQPPTAPRSGPDPSGATAAASSGAAAAPEGLSGLVSALPQALQTLSGSASALTGPVEAIGGSNPFGYLAGMIPAVASVGSVNMGKAALAKISAATAPPPTPTPSTLFAAELAAMSPQSSAGAAAVGGGGSPLAAQLGQADTVGRLSVPRNWTVDGPAIRPAAISLPQTPVAAAVPSLPATVGGIGLAGAAGGAMSGVASRLASRPAPRTGAAGTAPRGEPADLDALHEAIIRDVLAGAEYWGGLSSRACQDFLTRLGRNFQTIHEQTGGRRS